VNKFFQYLFRVILLLFAVVTLYFVLAIVLSYIPASAENTTVSEGITQIVYIQSEDAHLDIVLPIALVDTALKAKLNVPDFTKYIAFGWGNKEFYFNVPQWKDLSVGLAFRALFMQLEAAQHVVYSACSQENWTAVQVHPLQLKALNNFIANSFVLEDGKLKPCLCPGYCKNDCFYDAKGKYSCINTCNVWVNDAMKASSIPTAKWSPFHFGVLQHLP